LRFIIVSIVIGSAFYILLFMLAYRGSLEVFINSFKGGNGLFIIASFVVRAIVLTIHGIAWWILMRVFKRLNLSEVLKVTYTSVFTEFLIPLGGITEIVKVALITKLKILSTADTLASLFAHRIVLSLSILTTTLLALVIINAPLILYIVLLAPAILLTMGNIIGFIVPSSKKVESFVNKVIARFGFNISGFSTKYSSSMRSLSSNPVPLISSFIVEIFERFTNAIFGYFIALSIGIKISLLKALLAFDSLYVIMWLLPLVTPGGLGIYETIQTTLLSFLGIEMNQAATASIISRLIYLSVGYGLFTISLTSLGVGFKSLIQSISRSSDEIRDK